LFVLVHLQGQHTPASVQNNRGCTKHTLLPLSRCVHAGNVPA
jgi:hypothetical protein